MSDTTEGVDKGPPPPVNPAVVRPPGMTSAMLVEKYLALRDKMAAIKEAQKAELNRYANIMGTLEGWMLEDLNNAGINSIAGPAGTFYKTTRASAKVVKWADALDWIKQNEAWELLEARVSKVQAEAIVAETGQPIPGIAMTREHVLNVRKASD